ncbi:hypothetical protein VE01_04863 [Pseudogymnoascus verrucosus]|uniref:Monopolin complex subunit Csm1/Pcs1 C-terminal domain-containing protein n=1 Tax=Pseudogymnoascus verrucosus TaxID=342668 RepID=A0A1B8GMV3_9PEZI|nr:uncharacterized protein VE01_04863 [Pseudogymnoascus verrucosus]OBT97146.1 hypothetical protein VE01_04863 [Pseudogymnoascus verrucosus]
MPRLSYSRPGLTGLIDSDSDDAQFEEQSTIMSPAQGNENAVPAPAKKARGRPKGSASKIVKAPKSPAAKKAKRPALKDRTNAPPAGSDSEDEMAGHPQEDTMTIDEEMPSMSELDASAMTIQETVKPVRPTKAPAAKKAPVRMTKAAKIAAAKAEEVEGTPKPVPKKKANPRKRQREEEEEIPETQVSPEDLEDEDVDMPTPMPVVYQNKMARTATNARKPTLGRPKATNVEEAEAPEPSPVQPKNQPKNETDLRKQLESLDMKYRNLREVGIIEAERTFEKHRRQTEESRKIADGLIATLKAELAAQTTQMKELRSLRKKANAQEDKISDLQAKLSQVNTEYKAETATQTAQAKETRELKRKVEEQEDEISDLQRKLARVNKSRSEEHGEELSRLERKLTAATESLSDAQNENKSLSAKLTAARAAAASAESNARAPGSAKKSAAAIRMMGGAEAVAAAQAAQLKEDLYRDLTGLIIRSVKHEEEEDVFDCIQTGRNGTLHFKFGVPNDKNADYEESQCHYVPQMDPSRDEELKELLPEYMSEELTFPRPQVDKFYARVVKALTEKPM